MNLDLPNPPDRYTPATERARNDALIRADRENRKHRRDLTIERPERLILYSPNGTKYQVVVDDAGVLGTTAVP